MIYCNVYETSFKNCKEFVFAIDFDGTNDKNGTNFPTAFCLNIVL